MAARPEIDKHRIGAHGHSMGASVAAGLATRRPIKALVMVSAFKSLPSMLGRYMVPGFLARERFDNEAAVQAYNGSILMVHGEKDEIVPVSHARDLAKLGGRKVRLVILRPDDHDVPWNWETFAKSLDDFYAAHGMIDGK